MICLTADVHHMSMNGDDQKYLRGTEVDAAQRYIGIIANYEIKTTLFLTGKCVLEEKEKIRNLLSISNLELGSHTYRAFSPRFPYRLSYRLLNRKNGPRFFQKYEIEKALSVFRTELNYHIVSWRDHAYRYDRNTPDLLKEAGIKYFSDIASPHYVEPFLKGELFYVPINVLPDHDYVYHGGRQPGAFNEDILMKTAFQTRAMYAKKWLVEVKEQIEKIVKAGGLATILAHPSCMEICDDFITFEMLCRFISQYETIYMKEIGQKYAKNFK